MQNKIRLCITIDSFTLLSKIYREMYNEMIQCEVLKSYGPNVIDLSEVMIDDRMSSTGSQLMLNTF